MVGGASDERASDLPLETVKRADALGALRAGVRNRSELMTALGVSRTTVHRIIRSLEDHGFVTQDGNHFRLTALGRTVAAEVESFRRSVHAADRLEPLLDTVGEQADTLDIEHFTGATVTTVEPSNPYAPLQRFMELLRNADSIQGFDTTTIAPVFVDDIRDEILGGMTVDVVYLPAVVDSIVDAYADEINDAMASGRVTLSTHDDLPFGLAIFDDTIGVGGYDPETGMLRTFVDTSNPNAREWARSLYRRYRDEATVLDRPLD
jgi:predicted transcriptional regulator